jgi:hypothetical protein
MAEQKQGQQQQGQQQQGQQGQQQQGSTQDTGSEKLTAGTLRQWIKEEIGNLVPGGKSTQDNQQGQQQTQQGQQQDIRSQVVEALNQLKTREERQQRDARIDKMLTEYEKPAEEKAPVERRKVEKFMRWGD